MHRAPSPASFLALLLTVVASLLANTGCSDSSDSSATSTTTQLNISSEHDWETGTEFYDWQTTATQARMEVRVRGFHHGNFRVRVFDGSGTEVQDVLYWYWDNVYVIDPDEYVDITFTDSGNSGLWTVQIDFEEFSGHLYLTLDATNTDPEPEVPPPPPPSSVVDTSFGSGGIASYEFLRGYGFDVAVDSVGRVVVAGTTLDDVGGRRLSVWRFLDNGTIDPLFASNGAFFLEPTGDNDSAGRSVAIDSADRILVTGWRVSDAGDLDLVLVRLTGPGMLDSFFGVDGFATYDAAGIDQIGTGVAVDSSGGILVSGNSQVPDNTIGNVVVLRYATNGTLDGSFGTSGSVETTNITDRCLDLAIDSSGRPVVVGERDFDVALWRFTSGGAVDTDFDADGVAEGTGPGNELRFGFGLAIHPTNGTIAVTGFRAIDTADIDMALWRFTDDGSADDNFNGTGFQSFTFGGGEALGTDIAFDSTDRLVVVGVTRSSGTPATDDAAATLWRYASDGSIDTTLGTGGLDRFDARSGNVVTAAAALVPLSGNSIFVAAGAAVDINQGSADVTAWRLIP